MIELSIIIVTWNCKDFVANCLTSIRSHVRERSEIIVVDNASTDGTVEMLTARFPEVRVLKAGANLGFARANNIGLRVSRGRYVALMNPDVTLFDGSLQRALAVLSAHSEIGILGPRMLAADGTVRRSGMRFPNLWNCLCDALLLHRVFGRWASFGGQLMADCSWDRSREVDVLNGWFWVVKREAVDQVGLLDEQFFMYGEDLDWCRRFRDAGWAVRFEPSCSAIHYGGASSGNSPLRFFLEMQRANLQYWRKHHGRSARLLHRLVLAIHHSARAGAYAAFWVTHRRDKEAAFKVRRSLASLRYVFGRDPEIREHG